VPSVRGGWLGGHLRHVTSPAGAPRRHRHHSAAATSALVVVRHYKLHSRCSRQHVLVAGRQPTARAPLHSRYGTHRPSGKLLLQSSRLTSSARSHRSRRTDRSIVFARWHKHASPTNTRFLRPTRVRPPPSPKTASRSAGSSLFPTHTHTHTHTHTQGVIKPRHVTSSAAIDRMLHCRQCWQCCLLG